MADPPRHASGTGGGVLSAVRSRPPRLRVKLCRPEGTSYSHGVRTEDTHRGLVLPHSWGRVPSPTHLTSYLLRLNRVCPFYVSGSGRALPSRSTGAWGGSALPGTHATLVHVRTRRGCRRRKARREGAPSLQPPAPDLVPDPHREGQSAGPGAAQGEQARRRRGGGPGGAGQAAVARLLLQPAPPPLARPTFQTSPCQAETESSCGTVDGLPRATGNGGTESAVFEGALADGARGLGTPTQGPRRRGPSPIFQTGSARTRSAPAPRTGSPTPSSRGHGSGLWRGPLCPPRPLAAQGSGGDVGIRSDDGRGRGSRAHPQGQGDPSYATARDSAAASGGGRAHRPA